MPISISPYLQSNAAGSFVVESDGLIVGTAYPDPAVRYALAGGTLDSTETLPMWGGIPVQEIIPQSATNQPRKELQSRLKRSTTDATVMGIAVFDQNYSWTNSPQSPVPQGSTQGQVNFYRIGSGARIALEIDPALISLEGGLTNQAVTFDYAGASGGYRIIAGPGAFPVKILQIQNGNSMCPRYASGTGFLTWLRTGAAAVCLI
jgi:hypothetical protein